MIVLTNDSANDSAPQVTILSFFHSLTLRGSSHALFFLGDSANDSANERSIVLINDSADSLSPDSFPFLLPEAPQRYTTTILSRNLFFPKSQFFSFSTFTPWSTAEVHNDNPKSRWLFV